MLDFFSIFSKGGILLWCFRGIGIDEKDWDSFTPAINSFIKTFLLQEKTNKNALYETTGSLALKYRLDNEFELVFVAGYQKMLPLLYLDKLLDEIQRRFRDRFMADLTQKNFFGTTFGGFDNEFEKTLKEVEHASKKIEPQVPRSYKESKKSEKSIGSMMLNKNDEKKDNNCNNTNTAAFSKKPVMTPEIKESKLDNSGLDEETIRNNIAKLSMKGKKVPGPYKAKSPKPAKENKNSKKKSTTWDPFIFGSNGNGPSKEEMMKLDRSQKPSDDSKDEEVDHQFDQYVPDASVIGTSREIKLLDDESEEEDEVEIESKASSSGGGGLWNSLSSLVGSKQLSKSDIEPVISKLKDHLISKNVAAEVADELCESVAGKMEGRVLGTFSSVHRTVKDTLNDSLIQLLTPKRRVDIIRDVWEAKDNKRPYVITFCGVNGVGKSTNLAKICFWLVENKFRVMVAACDTFRAGAVEQLKTHGKRLNNIYPSQNQPDKKPVVEIYDKGYGKDAAGIAMEAISSAKTNHYDVVLIDTAGRMQDNEPLMRSLSKLISVNAPDLVLFVGEALVGNEAVDQLVKFNKALADHSSQSQPHLIDGIVLTKFDTIDDKVGSAISMTYITGQPIVFVGTGQTYTDLKTINSKAVVQLLMK